MWYPAKQDPHPVASGPGALLKGRGMTLSRRSFLAGAGSLTAASVLAGCSGFGKSSSKSSGGASGSAASGTITFMTWASDAEKSAFTKLVDKFESSRKGVTVNLRVVPYAEMFTNVDTQLQAGNAPDVFRVDYPTLGLYSSTGQLLDLSDKIDTDTAKDFIPALYQAVKYDDKPFGVPHQTDTTCIVYQPAMLKAAGIASVPDSLDSAWSWEEWNDVATKVQGSLGSGVNAFAYDWQQYGAYRWLTWLFEAGGRLLEDDLTTPAIVSDEGRKALEYTLNFFEQGWIPANTSVKGATYPDTAFISQKIAMAYAGDFLLPGIDAGVKNKFDWQVTYQPKDVRASTDLGGNALVATQQSQNQELAAEFLNFMVEADNMKAFCEESIELPTLNSLVGADLSYATRPDLMPTFVEQATTMTPEDVSQVTVPFFGQINTMLQNELELCFTSGQSVDDTLDNIASGLEKAAR
jgi:multiple sugar transport system substrate-binding protein